MSLPDIVYVVRPGERNEELRYSLRSLVNLPHGKVWIAGHKPSWVSEEVGHISTQVKPGGHVHAKGNLKAACEHPEVSEEFVYMNDDFFIMQPLERMPVMHRGPLSEVIHSRVMANAYTRSLDKTMQVLAKRGITEPLMYDLHAPLTVTKAGMLEALALCRHPHMQERTLFGNLNAVGGERAHNYKVRRQDRAWDLWPFLSTNDNTFRILPVGEYIRGKFREASPYEAIPPVIERGAPSRIAPTPRRPIRRTAGALRRIQARAAA